VKQTIKKRKQQGVSPMFSSMNCHKEEEREKTTFTDQREVNGVSRKMSEPQN
jgi:hypothetical protein